MSRDEQIEEMAKDVQEALKHNSTVDAIRHRLICVNSDGVARELFDDGYRQSTDLAEEIFAEIEAIIRKHDERPKYQLMLDLAELRKKYTEVAKRREDIEKSPVDC